MFSIMSPSVALLPAVVEALRTGWSSNTLGGPEAARRELALIERDPAAYVALLDDREARGGPVLLPDGSEVPRLPGFQMWMWDGDYAGNISLRWKPGTADLPPTCLGHIGYGVVPWKRRRRYASRALALMLPHARALGLPYVEITTDTDNVGSRAVIEGNGGILVEEFLKPASLGGTPTLRFRIAL